jgi:hypothetical protein
MGLQVLQDSKGKATGVFIPINQWKELKKQYRDLEVLEHDDELEPTKEQILQGIKQAVKEINLIKAGKKKARNVEDFLNEL